MVSDRKMGGKWVHFRTVRSNSFFHSFVFLFIFSVFEPHSFGSKLFNTRDDVNLSRISCTHQRILHHGTQRPRCRDFAQCCPVTYQGHATTVALTGTSDRTTGNAPNVHLQHAPGKVTGSNWAKRMHPACTRFCARREA